MPRANYRSQQYVVILFRETEYSGLFVVRTFYSSLSRSAIVKHTAVKIVCAHLLGVLPSLMPLEHLGESRCTQFERVPTCMYIGGCRGVESVGR